MSAAVVDVTDEVQRELERATSDYLSVSRGAHLFNGATEYQRAEEKTWERLTAARAAAGNEAGVAGDGEL